MVDDCFAGHTSATLTIALGCDIRIVQKILRHNDVGRGTCDINRIKDIEVYFGTGKADRLRGKVVGSADGVLVLKCNGRHDYINIDRIWQPGMCLTSSSHFSLCWLMKASQGESGVKKDFYGSPKVNWIVFEE